MLQYKQQQQQQQENNNNNNINSGRDDLISKVFMIYYLKCLIFNKKLWDTQKKNKVLSMHKKTSSQRSQILDLLDEDFKPALKICSQN